MDNEWLVDVSKNVMNKIVSIVNVWQAIGVIDEKFTTRSNALRQHVYNLLDDMLEEEKQHMHELEDNIKSLNNDIDVLCNELKTTANIPTENSLVKNESQLMAIKKELVVMRQNRRERFHKMIDMEKEICERLFEYRSEFDPKKVPTELDLDTLNHHIRQLQSLQASRKEGFISKRNEVIEMFKLLDKPIPDDAFVEKVFNDKLAEEVPLSNEFLSQCDRLIKQLLDEWERNKVECIKLRSRYSILYEILYPSKSDTVYNLYASKESDDYTCKTLEMLRSDVSLLEKCRLDKMEEFIKNYQLQIREKMNTILLSHFQEMEPYRSLLNSCQKDEELLQKLELELDNFIDLEKQVLPIVNEINNWNTNFNKSGELKLKLKDPVVLKNRGGILLKVNKELSQVTKELPKYEKKIAELLSSLKSEIIVANDLLIDNMRVLDYITYQWQHGEDDKENEKKMASKLDMTKSVNTKSATLQKKTPLTKFNCNVTPSSKVNIVPQTNVTSSSKLIGNFQSNVPMPSSAISTSSGIKKPAFRIPQLKKTQPKQQPISPINKFSKKVNMGLDRRFSRSCSELADKKVKKTVLSTSNNNLYGMFCMDIEPGVGTSSFIE